MNDPRQKLADHVQAALPLFGRLRVTTQPLVAGETPSAAERSALVETVPDWLPGGAR